MSTLQTTDQVNDLDQSPSGIFTLNEDLEKARDNPPKVIDPDGKQQPPPDPESDA